MRSTLTPPCRARSTGPGKDRVSGCSEICNTLIFIRSSPLDDEVIFKPIKERRDGQKLDNDPNDNPSNNFDYENETFEEDPEETKGSSFNDEEEEVS